jgi:hypothetical protein
MLDSTRRGFLKALGIASVLPLAPVAAKAAPEVFHVEHLPPEFTDDEVEILRHIVNQLDAERITGRQLIGYRVYSKSSCRPAGVTMEFATVPKEKADGQ